MSVIAVTFLLVSAVALLLLPRRWAAMPLIAGACYMTLGQGIELGPFTFTVIRMLVAVGVLRVVVRAERLTNGFNELDWVMVLWCGCAAISGVFHREVMSAIVSRLGFIYNVAGIYFLLRIFCSSVDDVVRLCRAMACLLALVALEMFYEQMANYNFFSILGGVSTVPEFREGRIRASGPFAHSILAGTVGATTLPLMIALWQYHKITAVLGMLVCVSIIVTSASSGPVMSSFFALGALFMWRYRRHSRLFFRAAVSAYLLLAILMTAPPYYLLARIDLVGGSTGWYRARLIESAIEHVSEWWLAGTDYTRHWMMTPGAWSQDQADITNYYLTMGIAGGLPLMLLFIATIGMAFSFVGRKMRDNTSPSRQRFMVWALGSALFAHAATCISVSYFDQSFLFLYLTLAAIGSARHVRAPVEVREKPRMNPAKVDRPVGHGGRRSWEPVSVPLAAPRHGRAAITSSGSRGKR